MLNELKLVFSKLKLRKKIEPIECAAFKTNEESRLFNGSDSLFKRHVSGIASYGEYGVGLSTKWVLRETSATIFSVDTDQRWIDKVQLETGQNSRLDACYCDVGPVENWGWPVDYKNRDKFVRYTTAWWNNGVRPDVVLIDGRFRVCCFLTSLKFTKIGSKIIFDDYFDRPQYHLVEEFLKPVERCGRQAMFIKSDSTEFDRAFLDRTIDRFQFIRE